MEFHLEHGLRLNQKPEHPGLYEWAVNEVDEKGKPIGRDQIPWPWSFVFAALSCEIITSAEVKTVDFMGEALAAPEVAHRRLICAKMRPDVFRGENDIRKTHFSMFGTTRDIKEFGLNIYPLTGEEPESCSVWGSVSYTAEDDLFDRTEPDTIIFSMMVKPDTFARYAALIAQNAVSGLSLRVNAVQGFYSDWSPSISTSAVKVLARGEEQKIEPQAEGIDPPRLGKVGEAELTFTRRLVFERVPTGEITDEPDPNALPPRSSVADPHVLKAILALKRAVWVAVAVLAVHFLVTLGR